MIIFKNIKYFIAAISLISLILTAAFVSTEAVNRSFLAILSFFSVNAIGYSVAFLGYEFFARGILSKVVWKTVFYLALFMSIEVGFSIGYSTYLQSF